MKKLLFVTLIVSSLCFLLAAVCCAENVSLTYLTNRTDFIQDGTYDKLLARFQEEHPDITVVFEGITDYAGELATRMQTTEYGDVLMIPDAVPVSALSNFFLPLGTPESFADIYRQPYLYSKYYDGQVYGLSYLNTVTGLVYNKRIWAEAGIETLPKSVDEFLSDLKLIKEKTSAIPYYTNANSGWTLDQWEDHAFGTLTGDPDYRFNGIITDKETFAPGGPHYILADMLYKIVDQKLCEDDPSTADWEASKVKLNNGEIATMLLGNWALSQIKNAGDHGDDVSYMPFPYEIDGKQYASSNTDYCYAINKNTKYPEQARAWIDFMINESGMAVDQGGISLLLTDPMPAGLEAFEDVELVVNNPATDENMGVLDEVESESGIVLYDNGVRMNRVVAAATGASGESFDDVMASLTEDWTYGIESAAGE